MVLKSLDNKKIPKSFVYRGMKMTVTNFHENGDVDIMSVKLLNTLPPYRMKGEVFWDLVKKGHITWRIKIMNKVNQEVSGAMENAIELYGKENVLKEHQQNTWTKNLSVLNDFTDSEMESFLNDGYEVFLIPPEDILRRKYEELSDYEEVDRAMRETFRYVLNTLNIKVEGIN